MPDEPVKIYVGGRIVDHVEEDVPHARVYKALALALNARKLAHVLPIRRSEFAGLPPRRFFEVIDRTIQAADGIIVILSPGDGSSPVEAAMAAGRRKPQVILSVEHQRPRRLLAGLPGVVEALTVDPDKLESQIEFVVNRLLDAIKERRDPLVPPFVVE